MDKSSVDFPDVAKKLTAMSIPLDEIGMSEVFVPINLALPSPQIMADGYKQKPPKSNLTRLNSQLKMSINLSKAEVRGIHMSRLYLICQKELFRNTLSEESFTRFVKSIDNISTGTWRDC